MTADRPERIGRYEILDELGRGSMGRVYLARDPNIDRRLALKVLEPHPGVRPEDEAELRHRFVLEARAAGKVSHPGIVTVYDAQTDPQSGASFIAMEWVDGVSLEQLLREEGPLPVERAVTLLADVAEALDAAHRAGLVHRDIKPANLLLDSQGRVKISDFGIAKLASQSQTVAGRILGSPFYMSPEQVRSETLDGRSDLFSLGVVLYQAVSGFVPFGGESLAGITYKILEIDPRPLRSIHPQAPASLAAVVDRALEKSPSDRFPNGRAMATALRAVFGPGESTSPAGTLLLDGATGSRHVSWPAVAGVLIAGVLGVLAVGGLRGSAAPPENGAVPSVTVVGPTAEMAPAAPVAAPDLPPSPEPAAHGARPSPRPSSPRPGARPAVLEVLYANRLRSGVLTLHVDDRRVWSRRIGADGGLFERALGDSVNATLEVSPGKHVVGVTIEGSEGTIEASKRIWGTFESGRVHRLRVVLIPPSVLRLTWKE